jgi:hypothetical protein
MYVLPTILLAIAIAITPYCNGPAFTAGINDATITPSACLLLLAAFTTALLRLKNGLPVVPLRFLREPAVIVTIVYFTIGVSTYFFAFLKIACIKEIVQRIMIIWVPLYAAALGLRKIDQAKLVLLWYPPFVTFLAALSICAGASGGFNRPVYILGLHKNMLGGLAASSVIICLAHLLTSRRPKIRLLGMELPNKLIFGGVAALGLLSILADQSRGALMEVLVGFFAMLIAIRAKRSTIFKVAALVVIGALIVYKLLPEKAAEHVTTLEEHSANYVRVMLWTESWNRFLANPFFFTGWGNGFRDAHGNFYYDMVCVFFYDLMQMTMLGAVTLLVMIFFSIKIGFDNAKLLRVNSVEAFVNAAALGIVSGKFAHAMVDTFWIARGHTFHIWPCIGMTLFIKMWLEQKRSSLTMTRANRGLATKATAGATATMVSPL